MAATRQHKNRILAHRLLCAVLVALALIAARRAATGWRTVVRSWFVGPTSPATDEALADRVRSALGPIEHVLDIPRIHVMVERGVAMLHGDVPDERTGARLVAATSSVPGVQGVVSKLHVGLLAGDTRPSAAHLDGSQAHARLVDAAVHAGGGEVTGERAVAAVLAAFASEVGPAVSARVRSHLPADVASLLTPEPDWWPASAGDDSGTFYERVALARAMPERHIPWVSAAVLRTLRSLAPDDADAIEHALPARVAHLWADASAPVSGA
jgi:uncharacterized protein (DUF2267 family)